MKHLVALALLGSLFGCASQQAQVATVEKPIVVEPKQVSQAAGTALFEVHKEGRIYFFYDYALYQDFLNSSHKCMT
ncbi:MAG: hypothetical protein HOM11_03150, partial [Methylococcales bacterium]|nr:hypothetical protein [Methylococcales bacterium]